MSINQIKRRFADARNSSDILKKKYKNIVVDIDSFKGYISLLEIIEVKKEWKVDQEQRCILANGYKWLEIYPKESNYCITAMYDNKNNIVEWYIDIANNIGIENGVPYEDDLFLDVVILPDGRINLLDEDELKQAYKNNIITKKQYDFAYLIAKDIMENAKNQIHDLKNFSDKYLNKLENTCEV